ncbi:MAG: hypothetical protein Q4C99_00050 [Clostridia bacterium]|nr:hypothetical protein [Clostridia bacterium]
MKKRKMLKTPVEHIPIGVVDKDDDGQIVLDIKNGKKRERVPIYKLFTEAVRVVEK